MLVVVVIREVFSHHLSILLLFHFIDQNFTRLLSQNWTLRKRR